MGIRFLLQEIQVIQLPVDFLPGMFQMKINHSGECVQVKGLSELTNVHISKYKIYIHKSKKKTFATILDIKTVAN